MDINLEKIEEIYGYDMLVLINDNLEEVVANVRYLKHVGFNDVQDIFERYPAVFICGKNEFKIKINNLINEIGIDYVYVLENNIDLWEKLV